MNVLEELGEKLKKAMMQKLEVEKRVLRMLISAVKNFEVSSGRPITEDEFDTIVKKQIKEREEAMEDYKRAGREQLYEEERAEKEILLKFAKPELSDEELKIEIKKIIDALQATSMENFGKVMGMAMKKLRGKASGERVRRHVENLLKSKKNE